MTNPPPGQGYPPPGYPPPGSPPPGYPTQPGYAPPQGYTAPPGYTSPPGYPLAPLSPGGQPLASFGERLAAYLLDGLILGAASLVLLVPWFIVFFTTLARNGYFDQERRTPDPLSGPETAAVFGLYAVLLLLIIAVQYVYLVEMQWRRGQTVGKRVMKIRVVPFDPRQASSRGIFAKRYLIQILVASCVPGFQLLDGLWQLWDKPYQQCLHDKFAQTVVVKVGA